MVFLRLRTRLFLVALLALVLPAATAGAQTNKPSPADDQQNLIEALIQEVRQLRLTLERNTVTVYRAQIAVERLRVQQEVVNRLSRDLDQVRQQAGSLRGDIGRITEMVEEMAKKEDAGLIDKSHLRDMKAQAEAMKHQEESLRERETSLTNQLHTENGKLTGLNQRLDMLEQVLESIQNLEPPKKEKKKD